MYYFGMKYWIAETSASMCSVLSHSDNIECALCVQESLFLWTKSELEAV